jgi:hypothetical protein
MVISLQPEAICFPLQEKETEVTTSRWPSKMFRMAGHADVLPIGMAGVFGY